MSGPFARSVADLAACYDALQGLDAEDPQQAPRAPELVSAGLRAGLAGLRVDRLGGWFGKQHRMRRATPWPPLPPRWAAPER